MRFTDIKMRQKLLLLAGVMTLVSLVVFVSAFYIFSQVRGGQKLRAQLVSCEVYFFQAQKQLLGYNFQYDGNEKNPTYQLLLSYLDSGFTSMRKLQLHEELRDRLNAGVAMEQEVREGLEGLREAKSVQHCCDTAMSRMVPLLLKAFRDDTDNQEQNIQAFQDVRMDVLQFYVTYKVEAPERALRNLTQLMPGFPQRVVPMAREYQSALEQMVDASRRYQESDGQLSQRLEELVSLVYSTRKHLIAAAQYRMGRAQVELLSGGLLLIVLGLVIASWVARRIVHRLRICTQGFEILAHGGLNMQFEAKELEGSDELILLMRGLVGLRDKLREVVVDIQDRAA